MRTYHWSVSIGSTTAPLRSPRGIIDDVLVDAIEQALRLEVGDDALARDEAVEAAVGRRRVVVERARSRRAR